MFSRFDRFAFLSLWAATRLSPGRRCYRMAVVAAPARSVAAAIQGLKSSRSDD
jgi:hypothetical protein